MWFFFDLLTASLALLISLAMLSFKHSLKAVFCLIALAFLAACRALVFSMHFYALLFFLIYLGAVLVLFLFVLMSLQQRKHLERSIWSRKKLMKGFFLGIGAEGLYMKYFPPAYWTVDVVGVDSYLLGGALAEYMPLLLVFLGFYLLVVLMTTVLILQSHKERA